MSGRDKKKWYDEQWKVWKGLERTKSNIESIGKVWTGLEVVTRGIVSTRKV